MLINDSDKFIFIHVQKTAGISIEELLTRHFPDTRRWHGRHGRACDGIDEVGHANWERYFSFAFVRNPWDRIVSWYNMIEARRLKLRWYQRLQPKPLKSRLWNQLLDLKVENFEQFLERCTMPVFDEGCWKSFAYNQIDYLTDRDGRLVVDYVGRFENIEKEMRIIGERIGISGFSLPRRNVEPHEHYSSWYNDRTRNIVADRFSRDINAFGYFFE